MKKQAAGVAPLLSPDSEQRHCGKSRTSGSPCASLDAQTAHSEAGSPLDSSACSAVERRRPGVFRRGYRWLGDAERARGADCVGGFHAKLKAVGEKRNIQNAVSPVFAVSELEIEPHTLTAIWARAAAGLLKRPNGGRPGVTIGDLAGLVIVE